MSQSEIKKSKVIEIHGQEDFDKHVKQTAVVMFWCEMSRPAEIFRPIFESQSVNEENSHLEFLIVDVGVAQDIAETAGIHGKFPSFQLYKDGHKLDEHLGPFTEEGLVEMLAKSK